MSANTDFDADFNAEAAAAVEGWWPRLLARLPNWLRTYFGLNMTEAEKRAFEEDQQYW